MNRKDNIVLQNIEWSSEARDILRQVGKTAKESEYPRICILDFDNTCIEGDCGALIHHHLSQSLQWSFSEEFFAQIPTDIGGAKIKELWHQLRGITDRSSREYHAVRHKLFTELMFIFPRHLEHFGAAATYRWATTLYIGLTEQTLIDEVDSMLIEESTVASHMESLVSPQTSEQKLSIHRGIRPRTAFRQLIQWLTELGLRPHIVSASNHWTVKQAARWTGIPSARIHGNRAEVRDGVITSDIIEPVTWGPGKAKLACALAHDPPLLAIGDSRTDVELLECAEHAILVDRGNSKLREHAHTQGWGVTAASRFSTRPFSTRPLSTLS